MIEPAVLLGQLRKPTKEQAKAAARARWGKGQIAERAGAKRMGRRVDVEQARVPSVPALAEAIARVASEPKPRTRQCTLCNHWMGEPEGRKCNHYYVWRGIS